MYRDMNDIVRDFWECSLKNDFSEFDWDEAFDEYEPYLRRNVAAHGLLGEEEYRSQLEEIYGDLDVNVSENSWMVCNGLGCVIGPEMIADAIVKLHVEQLTRAYGSSHGVLLDLLERIGERGDVEAELVTLFDECIHAQHLTGDILEDCDVEAIREEVESNRKRFATNIRDFL